MGRGTGVLLHTTGFAGLMRDEDMNTVNQDFLPHEPSYPGKCSLGLFCVSCFGVPPFFCPPCPP